MAYVFTRTSSGANVRWKNISSLNTYATLTNSSGITTGIVYDTINFSLNQWATSSGLDLKVFSTTNKAQPGRNDIYFSSDSLFFNDTGVLAITQVAYTEVTGDISEADIVINDRVVFSSNPLDKKYLGNVLTHEIGHMLGLGHSQVEDAAMLFVLAKGQHTLSNDDKTGIRSVLSRSGYGKIQGMVIGGSQRIGVFGAHVEAISNETGLAMGAALSDVGGGFEISGLPLNDTYYLYVKPVGSIESLPDYYSTIQTNFCHSGKKYRGSFFQQCGLAEQGLPFGITLNSSVPNYNVGLLTIRCGLDSPDEYLDIKDTVNSYTPSLIDINSKVGQAYSGFFSNYDLGGEVPDHVFLDLSSYNIPVNTYLNLKLLSQLFYSQVKLSLEVQNMQSLVTTSYPLLSEVDSEGLLIDSDGNPNLDILAKIPLTPGLSANNVFKLKITPQTMSTFLFGKTINDLSSYFQGYSYFKDEAAFYLLMISLSQPQVDGTHKSYQFKSYPAGLGNLQCPDAPNTYVVKSVVPTPAVKNKKNSSNDNLLAACGSVDMSGPSSSGPSNFLGSFCLSFLLILMVDFFRRPKKVEFPRL